jgi:lipoyl(octanoyl) transferase
MAIDEALLEAVTGWGQPVLRFYGWTEPAATFGYAQRIREVETWTQLRPLIRRPTGGGLVPHAVDWTYSLVFPPCHSWYQLKAVESYRCAHEWIHRAFDSLGVPTRLSPTEKQAPLGQCFVGAERFDLLWNESKLAGAAQRRNRYGLLIQGSVQPGIPSWVRGDWEKALLEAVPLAEKIDWKALQPGNALVNRAEQLARDKYSQSWHNERR